MKIKLLLYTLLLFIPSVTWAIEVSNVSNYVIDGIQRDANQHVIGKTICNTVTRECIYYAFDEKGNLLMRCHGNTKNVFKYSSAGLLRKEINYVYPDGVYGYPEEEQYIESQVSHWLFFKIAQENYYTLPKAYEELSPEERVELDKKNQADSNIKTAIATVAVVGIAAIVTLICNAPSSQGGTSSPVVSPLSSNSDSLVKHAGGSNDNWDRHAYLDMRSAGVDQAGTAFLKGLFMGILSVWIIWKVIHIKRK